MDRFVLRRSAQSNRRQNSLVEHSWCTEPILELSV